MRNMKLLSVLVALVAPVLAAPTEQVDLVPHPHETLPLLPPIDSLTFTQNDSSFFCQCSGTLHGVRPLSALRVGRHITLGVHVL